MTILDRMLKAGRSTSSMLSTSVIFNDKEPAPTNLPILNIALSGDIMGGVVSGVTYVAGASKSFKTLIMLYMLKAYFTKYPDAVCLFYDNEFGATPEYFKSMGIDTERVIHIPIADIESLKQDIVDRLDKLNRGDKVFIMIDSLGNIASKKETEDALDGKAIVDMTRAKAMKSLFRLVTPQLTIKDIPLVAVQHIYKEQGSMYPSDVIAGGCLEAGTRLIMADDSLKNIEDIQVGEFVMTAAGPKEVTATWNPETLVDGNPECYEIEFEDGSKVVCSENHPFFVGDEWVPARQLIPGQEVANV